MGVHRKTRNLELVLDAFRNAQEALSAQLLMERLPADVKPFNVSLDSLGIFQHPLR